MLGLEEVLKDFFSRTYIATPESTKNLRKDSDGFSLNRWRMEMMVLMLIKEVDEKQKKNVKRMMVGLCGNL
ncbi:hypothetical protein Ahy_A07g033896 isoform B [Arachis hypogaea]|uniref:Uncharacterized protein n=1 Tax=Arachis hypogaea TaxID=3818 RepID=A0A445CAF2_ARAHY|nr:hypothetical protein Ahy_A07g033896 isoform B [Arachis hypogaea]